MEESYRGERKRIIERERKNPPAAMTPFLLQLILANLPPVTAEGRVHSIEFLVVGTDTLISFVSSLRNFLTPA